jgi:WD40 repeat protein
LEDGGVLSDADIGGVLQRTEAPAEDLATERIIGFRAGDTKSSLHRNAMGELVYFSGAVCLVRSWQPAPAVDRGAEDDGGEAVMRIFRGHDGLVTCLAMAGDGGEGRFCPASLDGRLVASGQGPCQGSRAGRGDSDRLRAGSAYVCVWDCVSMEEKARLGSGSGTLEPEVVAVSISPAGDKVAVLCSDVRHTLSVWKWEEGGAPMLSVSTHKYPVSCSVYNSCSYLYFCDLS